MKKLILVFFVIFNGFSACGQERNSPNYFLNNQKVDWKKVYIHPSSIDSFYVSKKSRSGEVFIFTKNNEFDFLRLSEIISQYTDSAQDKAIAFKINGKLINDTTSIKIDDLYFIYVTVDKISDIEYLSDRFDSLQIINIDLETEEREQKFMIKGNNSISDILD
jgi:hypothetical protein